MVDLGCAPFSAHLSRLLPFFFPSPDSVFHSCGVCCCRSRISAGLRMGCVRVTDGTGSVITGVSGTSSVRHRDVIESSSVRHRDVIRRRAECEADQLLYTSRPCPSPRNIRDSVWGCVQLVGIEGIWKWTNIELFVPAVHPIDCNVREYSQKCAMKPPLKYNHICISALAEMYRFLQALVMHLFAVPRSRLHSFTVPEHSPGRLHEGAEAKHAPGKRDYYRPNSPQQPAAV